MLNSDARETPSAVAETSGAVGRHRPVPAVDPAISLVIFFATLAAYSSATRFGFITWDDPKYIVENPHLRDGFALRNLNWIFTSLSPDYWFPVTRLSLVLDYKLFGLQAAAYHIENIVIHALAALLLFGFLRRATGLRWPAAFVAFVFALHPLHVESVAWVSERKDVLCAFFWFATLWAWLRYTRHPATGRYLIVLGLFTLGLMSKPMIVTLPFLLLLLDLWPLRRRFSGMLVLEKIPFLALSIAVMWVTMIAQRTAGAMAETPPLLLRVENSLVTVAAFLADTFWPVRLSPDYPYPSHLSLWTVLAAAAGIVAVTVLVLRECRQRPYLATGWFWFLGTLIPVIGLVQVGLQSRSDHFMYVPLVGLSIMVAWGAVDLVLHWPAIRPWIAATAAAACLSMTVLTALQVQYWGDTARLFRRAIELDGKNYLAWNDLGLAISDKSSSEVISCYHNALRIRPDFAEAHNNLAVYLTNNGRLDEAIAEYTEALRINPALIQTHYNLAVALRKSGRIPESIDEFEAALRINPLSSVAHRSLGLVLASTGNLYGGIAQLEDAVSLEPDDELAQYNLARMLSELPGRSSDAIVHFNESLRINPRFAAAHRGLAALLLKIPDRRQEAIRHLGEAERIEPDPEAGRAH
jgi:Tfp pilus assembly protein PilF